MLKSMIWIVTESGKRKTGYKWARMNNLCCCDEVIYNRGNFGILQYVSKVRLINWYLLVVNKIDKNTLVEIIEKYWCPIIFYIM